MAWGALPAVAKLGIFAPIAGFFSGLVSRLFSWLLVVHLSGALYRVVVLFAFLATMFTVALGLVSYVNGVIIETYNNGGILTQTLINGIASFLPTYTPIYVSIILTYYLSSITVFISLEIIKFKQRVAIEASKKFIA